ncbi:hypothetical protein [Microcoleus sp. bin38.metabat.b11b12b14.051]|nr:hypothetical protein [Microcoleus sp. bin38.metabat.b11b12b14.051]
MYILDTDHLSVLDRGGVASQRLLQRLTNINISMQQKRYEKRSHSGQINR